MGCLGDQRSCCTTRSFAFLDCSRMKDSVVWVSFRCWCKQGTIEHTEMVWSEGNHVCLRRHKENCGPRIKTDGETQYPSGLKGVHWDSSSKKKKKTNELKLSSPTKKKTHSQAPVSLKAQASGPHSGLMQKKENGIFTFWLVEQELNNRKIFPGSFTNFWYHFFLESLKVSRKKVS